MNVSKISLLALVGATLLAGCTTDDENIQAWMREQERTMRGGVQPLPEIRPFPITEYSVDDLVPPFSPSRIVPDQRAAATGSAGLRPDPDRRKEPLEAFPLESLTMVGVLIQGEQKHALIRSGSVVHQVRVGNYMGQNFGLVTEIGETEVRMKELVEDINGDWSERTSSLLLQEQQGGRK